MKRKFFWWTLTALWCGLIFFMSSDSADESSNKSLFIAGLLNRWIAGLFGPHAFTVSEELVRKCAHFFEYLVLGSLLFMDFLDRSRPGRGVLLVIVTGLIFAVSDEIHQIFVPGRTPEFFDVLVDIAGIVTAIALMTGCRGRQACFRRVNGQCILKDGRPEGGRNAS